MGHWFLNEALSSSTSLSTIIKESVLKPVHVNDHSDYWENLTRRFAYDNSVVP